jgi:hypothetical protein
MTAINVSKVTQIHYSKNALKAKNEREQAYADTRAIICGVRVLGIYCAASADARKGAIAAQRSQTKMAMLININNPVRD